MPVFHTKTIESILEPVAQQVSRLVILHEEAEDGNLMPDLSRPVQAVKIAVDNLIKVGNETCSVSNDDLLRKDLPVALRRVEQSSMFLIDAASLLKQDPYSVEGRKMLIEGARGILQGVSALLLAFDESEVRKIIEICRDVLEQLALVESVELIEQLVAFVKNLSPILSRMTKEVDLREKELTHQIHRQLLSRLLEQVKNLTPALISGMKVYITAKMTGGHTIVESQENRDFIIGKLSDEIHEIIRILQLTAFDDEETWEQDEQQPLKKILKNIGNRLYQAKMWLSKSNALAGTMGEKSLNLILDEIRTHIMDNCLDQKYTDLLLQKADAISQMLGRLLHLRGQEKGDMSEAMSLSRNMSNQLDDLYQSLDTIIASIKDKSDYQRPAVTAVAKVDQALRWLANPHLDHNGHGELAIRGLIKMAHQVVEICEQSYRKDLLQCCCDIENLLSKYNDLLRRRISYSAPERITIARNLSEQVTVLQQRLQEAVIYQAADDFIDTTSTIKQLKETALTPFHLPNRNEIFHEAVRCFTDHSSSLIFTARLAANAAGCRSKGIIESINVLTSQINDLSPQVVYAARIVFGDPSNPSTIEHFNLIRDQWIAQMEHLRQQVDEAIPSHEFVKACEEAIIHDTQQTEKATADLNGSIIVDSTSNIVRRANRVLLVAQQEKENSEDNIFVSKLMQASTALKNTISPMIREAKQLAMNPNNNIAHSRWQQTNNELIDAVGNVRDSLAPNIQNNQSPPRYPLPDLSNLSLDSDNTPPRPPPPTIGFVPRRPPSPVQNGTDDDTDNELPIPQSNQPMLTAAYDLHMNIRHFSSRDNEIISAAKKMAHLVAQLSLLVRGEQGNKRDLISTAKELADMSENITHLARKLASECTDKRMRNNLYQVSDRIPTIGTQLKILSTVKATMLGVQGSEEDAEATEMLIGNSQNLMHSVKETVRAAEAASIKIRTDSGIKLKWVRKRPLY